MQSIILRILNPNLSIPSTDTSKADSPYSDNKTNKTIFTEILFNISLLSINNGKSTKHFDAFIASGAKTIPDYLQASAKSSDD
ncbi:hypothetical protein MKFW12EY_39720 [Methylomonas koyamae]|nr:hypothetical protein MKFW12EY_39720 [Methylomonas koyamae]